MVQKDAGGCGSGGGRVMAAVEMLKGETGDDGSGGAGGGANGKGRPLPRWFRGNSSVPSRSRLPLIRNSRVGVHTALYGSCGPVLALLCLLSTGDFH